jgi:hypothetical protein
LAVATKVDKLPATQRNPAVLRLGASLGTRAIGFSAHTGEGKEALWRAIRDRLAGTGQT